MTATTQPTAHSPRSHHRTQEPTTKLKLTEQESYSNGLIKAVYDVVH